MGRFDRTTLFTVVALLAAACGSSSSGDASRDAGAGAGGASGAAGVSGGGGGTGGTGGTGGGSAGTTGNGGSGGAVTPPPKTCAPAPGGSSGAVQQPKLQKTLAASWDENWLAAPALVDITGDGKPDIIAARHSVLYAWKNDGTPLWHAAWGSSASNTPDHGNTRMWASPVVGDFRGDGKIEIAVGSGATDDVAVYDASGELLPGWPVSFGGSDEVRSIAAADVDGDGKLEILVNKTNTGPATAVYNLDGTLHAGFPEVNHASCDPPPPAEACWDFGGYNQNIGAGDLDGDGVADVVSTYDAIGFGVFKGDGTPFPTAAGFADRVITAVEAYNDLSLSMQGWGTGDRSEFTYSPPVIADITHSGEKQIVLAGDHERSNDTTNRGITVWVLNHDMTRPTGWVSPKNSGMPLFYGDVGNNIVTTMPSPSVADLDGKPGLEIVVPSYDGKLYAYRSDGSVLWTYTFATTATPYTGASEALIADLNGDGAPEILFNTFSSGTPGKPDTPAHLIVLDSTGKQLFKVPLSGRGSMAAPSLADLDGDGKLELVISLKDTLGGGQGGVQIWDLPGATDNCVLWGTGRGDWLRDGYVP